MSASANLRQLTSDEEEKLQEKEFEAGLVLTPDERIQEKEFEAGPHEEEEKLQEKAFEAGFVVTPSERSLRGRVIVNKGSQDTAIGGTTEADEKQKDDSAPPDGGYGMKLSTF